MYLCAYRCTLACLEIIIDHERARGVSYVAGALEVCVAAVFYVLNLRTSIENRKAQLLMEFNKMISSKEWLTDLHIALNYEWKDYEEFWNKYWHPNPVEHSRWVPVTNSMVTALLLLRWNLVNEEMLRDYLGYVSMGAF